MNKIIILFLILCYYLTISVTVNVKKNKILLYRCNILIPTIIKCDVMANYVPLPGSDTILLVKETSFILRKNAQTGHLDYKIIYKAKVHETEWEIIENVKYDDVKAELIKLS